jgi:hypothetical protein
LGADSEGVVVQAQDILGAPAKLNLLRDRGCRRHESARVNGAQGAACELIDDCHRGGVLKGAVELARGVERLGDRLRDEATPAHLAEHLGARGLL